MDPKEIAIADKLAKDVSEMLETIESIKSKKYALGLQIILCAYQLMDIAKAGQSGTMLFSSIATLTEHLVDNGDMLTDAGNLMGCYQKANAKLS